MALLSVQNAGAEWRFSLYNSQVLSGAHLTVSAHTHTPVCIITGFQVRSRAGRWNWTLSPEEIMSREVELGCESWTSFASVVPQQQCNGHCLSDSVQAQQLKQQLRSAQVAGQWRGDITLTLPLFWRRSTVSPVFFGRYPRSSHHCVITQAVRVRGAKLAASPWYVIGPCMPVWQGSRRDQEILEEGRWSWTLKLAQKRS